MSAIGYVNRFVLPAANLMVAEALGIPLERIDTPSARAMLLAIGLQESRFVHRRQIRGPARSFWQAELGGGFRGILFHPATQKAGRRILADTGYGEPDPSDFDAIEHNDILACCGARLLLWTHPKALPQRHETEYAWTYYLDVWRPGKPHQQTWQELHAQAWAVVAP